MAGCKFKAFQVILTIALISKINAAPLDTNNNDQTPVLLPQSTTNKTPQEIPPISELIQIQTDAIKKILSTTTLHSNDNVPLQNTVTSKCEDIESGIKETIRKSNSEEASIFDHSQDKKNIEIPMEDNMQRGDLDAEDHQIISPSLVTSETIAKTDKDNSPSGRTLFTLYSGSKHKNKVPTSTIVPNTNYADQQNIILVPCIKRVVQDQNNTRRNSEGPTNDFRSALGFPEPKPIEHINTGSAPASGLVLDPIYSADGQFLYYMYRYRNLNQEGVGSSILAATTTSSTTTTTSNPIDEPLYAEQMRFVVQMPLTNPEPASNYPWKFDTFAYYPKELQPAYVNAPVAYKPTYHMIRTLTVPNEYNTGNGRFVMNDPQKVEYDTHHN